MKNLIFVLVGLLLIANSSFASAINSPLSISIYISSNSYTYTGCRKLKCYRTKTAEIQQYRICNGNYEWYSASSTCTAAGATCDEAETNAMECAINNATQKAQEIIAALPDCPEPHND